MGSVDACREYFSAKCKHTACYYCERQIGWHEHDHFPLPRRVGGKRTVPACVDCHALKDRITLQNWPPDDAWTAASELCKLIPEGVLATLDTERLPEAVWELPALSYSNVMKQWQSLPTMTRVLYAKIMAMNENALYDSARQ